MMARSNVGTLNRMHGSDAIGRVDCCPPSGRARAVSDQRRSRGLTEFLPSLGRELWTTAVPAKKRVRSG